MEAIKKRRASGTSIQILIEIPAFALETRQAVMGKY